MNKTTLLLAMLALLTGCATKDYVQEQVAPVAGRVDTVEGRVSSAESELRSTAAAQAAQGKAIADMQGPIKAHADRIARNEADIGRLSQVAQEAVERASAAGRMAQGKLVYEVVLSDDKLHFSSNHASLDAAGMALLDDIAARLKAENKGVYIEIQGYTDATGDAAANLRLGEARANAVRRHLNIKGGIPLHRMSVISYGESMPAGDNKTSEGRQQNRRVVLVVIQ